MSSRAALGRAFGRIHQLDHSHAGLTAETWADHQPVSVIRIGGRRLVVTQPSSTLWVYALGLLACVVAERLRRVASDEPVMQLWAIGLWLWGVGALLAGTSYQAFGFHLKCRDGRVRWTNWWEATYLICQQLSVSVLVAATAMLTTEGRAQTVVVATAIALAAGYLTAVLAGAFLPHRFLLSFELLCLVCLPAVVGMLVLHLRLVVDGAGDALDAALVGVWLGLIGCMAAYVLYLRSGLTQRLWERGRWFSENDVLHVTLIVWLLGIAATANLFADRVGGGA